MKKIILVLLASFLFACGGDNPSPTAVASGMNFKLNGVQKNYVGSPKSSVLFQNGKLFSIGIYGTNTSGETITFSVISTPATPLSNVVGEYNPITVLSNRSGTNLTSWINCPNSTNKKFTLTITEYNDKDKYILGKFTGNLCGTSDAVISDGTFKLDTQ